MAVVAGDFNGDGFEDMAIGRPAEYVGSLRNAGMVEVIFGASEDGLNGAGKQVINQNSALMRGRARAESNDLFGDTLAAGDFNNDGIDDLAIGAPGEDIGSIANAGIVHVLYGSSDGLIATRSQVLHQDSRGIQGKAEPNDYFGKALTAGDFDKDGIDDLAIGVPYEDVGSIVNAGAVNVIFGSGNGLSTRDQLLHQNSRGIQGQAESNDRFGQALVAGDFDRDGFDDLAIGVPLEDIGSIKDAGAVNVIYGGPRKLSTRDRIFHQNSRGIQGVAERDDRFGSSLAAGDFNNDTYDDLAIGVPSEDVGSIANAGAVNIIFGTNNGLTTIDQVLHQNSRGIQGVAEMNDSFGHSLTAGDLDGDGYDDLAIGVPYEDIASVKYAGAVNVIYGGRRTLSTRDQIVHQNTRGIRGKAESYDYFGSALAMGDFDRDGKLDLAVDVKGEDISSFLNAGTVNVIYGAPKRLTTVGDQTWDKHSTFDIQLNYVGRNVTTAVRQAVEDAARFWSEIIVGEIPDYRVAGRWIDDLVIEVRVEDIEDSDDGVGDADILANARFDARRPGNFLPATGEMTFDLDDNRDPGLFDIAIHEIGHVLGFSQNMYDDLGLLSGDGTDDPTFTGKAATKEYNRIYRVSETGVPLQAGARNSHWREEILQDELMTPLLDPGAALSRISVAALKDMGYTVNFAAAESFEPDDRFEENDSRGTAEDLGSASRLESNLFMVDGADWYQFTTTRTGTAGQNVEIRFQHASGDLNLALFDASGSRLITSISTTDNERISLDGRRAGTYFVRVMGFEAATNDTYSLEIVV